MIKRFFILLTMLFAMLFGCTQVNDDDHKSSNSNQQTNENQNQGNQNGENNSGNQNGNNQTPEDTPKTPIKITFIGADGEAIEVMEKNSGDKVVLVDNVANLSHWNTKADGSGLSYKGAVTFTESVTLYAILLAENAHTIAYMLNGGVNNPQNSFSFTEEDFIGLKNPTKAGYTFLGWYDNKNFTGKPIKGWAAGDKTANVTLYAKWEKEPEPAVKVTITFNTNGANVKAPEAITSTSIESVELPVLTGVNFSHWNTKADGSGQSYNGTAIFAESVTLYAILLAENAHTITYELNGGVNNPKNKFSFTEDEMVALREPTKDGYKFAGWYETASFSGEAIKVWFEGDKTANVTLYAKWEKDNSNNGDEPVEGGNGVYSYTLDIEDISNAWGGTTVSPSFSVVLLTDEQVEVCKAAQDFKQAPADNPEYQLGVYWNMSIADTSKIGDYAVYGQSPVNDVYHYYNGVAATITDKTFTLTVDMTKIVKTDLKALWAPGEEKNLTDEDIVDLTGRKPYVIALDGRYKDDDYSFVEVDSENYVFTAWSADVMKMEEGATFPTDLQDSIPTCYDLKYIYGNITEYEHIKLIDNTFTFIVTGENEFAFTNGTRDFYAGGALVTALDTEFSLSERSSNITFANGVLTEGLEYVITLIVKDKHEAYVKVEETGSKVTAISVNSASHKTTYNFAESLDVSGLTIEVTKEDATTKTVSVTSSMVSGFNPLELGTQTLTITYGGCTATFDVEVHEIETETVEATASNVYDKISGLSSGYYLLKLSGEITSSTIENIVSAMNYTSAKIILDLSETTGLTSIRSSNFWGCRNLISITLPDGLTSIGSDAFTDCSNLINVVIPESVTEIGHDAFKYCSKLISAEIPEGVTTINEQTFAYCSSLTSVTIPTSVTFIDYDAFQQCSSLTTVNYRGTQEQWEQIVIDYDNAYLKNASVNYNYTGSVLGKVTGITINSTSHKVSYNAGESLDVSGLTIEVTKEDATTKTVKVSSSMVSGFNSLELGTQTLTITYSRCTTTFDVEVIGTAYTIAFDANGGSGTMESLTVIENIIYKLDDEPFTAPDGYVFNSWNTKADGSGKTYYMNNSYSFSNDMTLYAVWEKVENNFDVSLPGSTSFSIYQSTDGDNVTFSCDYWRNYDSYTWYIDGVKQTSTSEEMTVDTSAMKAGIYTIMLKVKYNGTYWSETTTLTVNK